MPYQDIKDRLYHGHRKVANNTHLQLDEFYLGDNAEIPAECINMMLHGNIVVSFHKNCLYLYSAGWRTKTTRARLNMALQELANVDCGICQKNHRWYVCRPQLDDIPFTEGMRLHYQ